MQQIERYGVIALVFLLVTIVAISFWGDSKSPGFWSRLTGHGAKKELMARSTTSPPATAERALDGTLPLTFTPGAPIHDPAASGPPVGPDIAARPVDSLATSAVQSPVSVPPITSATNPVQARSANIAQTPAPIASTPPIQPGIQTRALPEFAAGAPSAIAKDTHKAVKTGAPAVKAPATGSGEYTVQKGDSLVLIARKILGSEQRWTEIQALNDGLQPKSLKAGMKLKLPAGASLAGAPSLTGSTDPPAGKTAAASGTKNADRKTASSSRETHSASSYTVRSGDTLNSIATQRLGDKRRYKDIVALNPGLDPRHLTIGRVLEMPGGEERTLIAAALPSSVASSKPHVR